MTRQSNIIRFPHRVVELPVRTLDDIVREHGSDAVHREPRHVTVEPERRLVAFFRERQFEIGMVCLGIATLAACWFAFQMGRGL